MPAPERVPPRSVTMVELLTKGELTVRGQIREASNAVLLCDVSYEGHEASCVYKPVAGERPLWDFPDGTLAQREVAAYEVSEATGWGLVPPTVLREGPYGEGMCQLWIDVDADADAGADADVEPGQGSSPERGQGQGQGEPGADRSDADRSQADPALAGSAGLLALVEPEAPPEGWKPIGLAEVAEGRTALLVHRDDPRLRRLAVLDAVINNADRKGGHLLPAPDGRLYGIDHGVTFNAENKLRTLLWGWAGDELTAEAKDVLAGLAAALAEDGVLTVRLAELITPAETRAVRERVAALLASGRHPEPGGEWPAIPWPPV
ncbi:SCO1664 family protein [Streptomyces tsukubensis]|uniref:Phosphatidylinositol kinase n=1 Tax=Streptomyces tsukubensis TaxID=83656 RepID=A0A1V4AF62_9ACTN|nr:SCO1664 family protein [Streptomyces tsukubensis]OON82286.1 phosphatidylinositol kinase [Streptomyces tsukubensis]QFR92776.1 SCO1664 family protein [Streptomyces tsukubensis]